MHFMTCGTVVLSFWTPFVVWCSGDVREPLERGSHGTQVRRKNIAFQKKHFESDSRARLKKYYLKKYYSIFENTIWDSDEKILLVFLKNKSTELMQIISKYVLFDQNWKILHERWRYYSWQVSWEDAQKNTLIRFIPTYEEAPCNFF